MNKLIIISYVNFLRLSEGCRKALCQDDDVLISIRKEDYLQLSAEDKKKLRGAALTDEKHNATAIENVKPKEPSPEEMKLFLEQQIALKDAAVTFENERKMAQAYRQKHLKNSRPYAPRKIINPLYNSKKKSGR